MKKIILCISALFTITSVVHAADSAGNRKDSIIMLGMSGGIHSASLLAAPARVAIILGDLTVGIDAGSADSSQSSGTAKSTASYTNQGLNARYFFGNSFNASLGYHMRNYSAEATSTSSSSTYSGGSWTTTTASETFTLDAKTTVATLGIGNHWLMDWGLWIGVDWLLASNALSQTSEATLTSSTGTVTAAESAQFKKDAEKLGDLINAISASSGFAVLTIGFAF